MIKKVAVVGAGILLYKNWDTITEWAGHLKNEVTVKIAIMKKKVNDAWESIKSVGTTVTDAVSSAWDGVIGVFENVGEKVSSVTDTIKEKWEGLKTFMKNPIKGTVNIVQNAVGKVTGRNSHADGAYNIPYDNYPANLHKGEMVLTEEASNKFRAMGGTEDSVPSQSFVTTTKSSSSGDFAPTLNITVNNPKDSKETVQVMKREWEKLMSQYEKRNNLRFGDA